MGETSVVRQDDFYLKGRSRHLFWLVFAVLPLCFWGYRLLPMVVRNMSMLFQSSLYLLFPMLSSVIVCAFLVFYGLLSKPKKQRALLITLAVLSLPELVHQCIYILLPGIQASIINAIDNRWGLLGLYNFFPALIFNGAWLICLIVLMTYGSSGGILRLACVPLAVYYGCLAYGTLSALQGGSYIYYGFWDYFLLGFRVLFFAALSYSKINLSFPLTPEEISANESTGG